MLKIKDRNLPMEFHRDLYSSSVKRSSNEERDGSLPMEFYRDLYSSSRKESRDRLTDEV